MYGLENAGRHDKEIVSQTVMDKCARDLIDPNEGWIGNLRPQSHALSLQKLMTPGPVDQLCPYFAEYLLHRDICKRQIKDKFQVLLLTNLLRLNSQIHRLHCCEGRVRTSY